MTAPSPIRSIVALLGALAAPPSGARAQLQLDVSPYAGLYFPTASLTSTDKLKQESSPTLGARITVWLVGRVGIEGTVNYALSDVTPTQSTSGFTFPGPSSAHVIARSVQALLRLNPSGNAIWHVGGGVGGVGYRGDAYNGAKLADPYLQAIHQTFSSAVVSAGTTIKPGRIMALRLDAEDYIFRAHFQCRSTNGGSGICFASPGVSTPKLQNDLVLSLALSAGIIGH
jgi:hypothetical protein